MTAAERLSTDAAMDSRSVSHVTSQIKSATISVIPGSSRLAQRRQVAQAAHQANRWIAANATTALAANVEKVGPAHLVSASQGMMAAPTARNAKDLTGPARPLQASAATSATALSHALAELSTKASTPRSTMQMAWPVHRRAALPLIRSIASTKKINPAHLRRTLARPTLGTSASSIVTAPLKRFHATGPIPALTATAAKSREP